MCLSTKITAWREENKYLLVSNQSPLKWILELINTHTTISRETEKVGHWITRQEN